MKYSLSNIIKDLLAKIPVLENRINTLSTKITNINNNSVVKKVSNSAPEGNTLTLVEGAIETDAFRIVVGDEGKDNLYVSFDTCDNGDEKIQFRQYGEGPYALHFSGTPIRTAVILGRNGETTFPVSVTAPKFVGSLQGNADNATKWNGIIDDHYTENNTATWIPVFLENKIQHIDRTKMTVGNADTVDGYHASDLLRTLAGGNKEPVMTDIFDRAGTIDLFAMSDADKARHKSLINKSPNAVQNLWNDDTGVHAYGGDVDMVNGYVGGTIKLTQSYKNFDKILVVACADDAGVETYRIWYTWELAHAFNSCSIFDFVRARDLFWEFFGTQHHGNATNYVLSTDTIWSCYNQNCGIVAIYGLSY